MIDPEEDAEQNRVGLRSTALAIPVFQTLKTGNHPHQAYRPTCFCPDGQPKEQRNYASHVIAPPRCSVCGLGYRLDITLMPTYEAPRGR